MKKSISTILLAFAITCGYAQTKQPTVPKIVTIVLTDQQVLKLDSCIRYGQSVIDSKSATAWYTNGFEPFYIQVKRQMVADSVKVVPVNKKP